MSKRHLVKYVENCSPKLKIFKSKKKMNKFIKKFKKLESTAKDPDECWVDLVVKNIKGKITSYDDRSE